MRQRQRLIDACISALHIYGPSRTTVEKVVAIAGLSPGIVRFYFDSKAAMLVASLAHLAAEFEESVLQPVGRLKHSPVRALELLVDLYLDPELASPRKVSVWYSFWGEASSRQEYFEICGKKDDDFAALVRELVGALIEETGARHLDADGIALGLIGVLEIIWQGFAYQNEANIDRGLARARTMAYLRSVFPGQFGAAPPSGGQHARASAGARQAARRPAAAVPELPVWACSSEPLLALERAELLRPAWQVVGHAGELARSGDFLSAMLAVDRVLVVRGADGALRAFQNACPARPHALVGERRGSIGGAIHCRVHGLRWSPEGRSLDPGGTDLTPLELAGEGGVLLARPAGPGPTPPQAGCAGFDALVFEGIESRTVAADWKLLVEQWLECDGRSAEFLEPNQLIERSARGARILQVVPLGAGRSRVNILSFRTRGARATGRRRPRGDGAVAEPVALETQIELAESTQSGLAARGGALGLHGAVPAPLERFRRRIAALLPQIQPPA